MDSEIRTSFIETAAIRSRDVNEIYCGEFDFLLASASWDRRSVSLTKSNSLASKSGLLLHYKKKDNLGLSKNHLELLQAFFSGNVSKHETEIIEATCIEDSWELVKQHLASAFQIAGRPLNIFIDLSTTPRFLTLGALGFGFQHGLVRSATYAYAEGCYSTRDDSQEIFTEGGWKIAAIPGFSGQWDPTRSRHYVVSVGFEGVKTRQLVSKSEPDLVSVLFPDPPVQEEYRDRTHSVNRPLIEDFNVGDREMRSHAADVVSTLDILEKANVESFDYENCLYVCCGTKPHSLSLAIRSLVKTEPGVLYIVPESHRVLDVKPNGTYWRYKVVDFSSPETSE